MTNRKTWLTIIVPLLLVALVAGGCATEGSTATPSLAEPSVFLAQGSPLASPTPVPIPTPTATSPMSPLGFSCRSYLDLLVSAGGAEEQAVVTSYRCHNMWIDSTGRLPPKSPSLVVPKGVPLHFRLAAEQQPATVEVRVYSEVGVSASFFIWPEELPIKVEPVDRFQPAPTSAFEYLPQVAPGEYALVVRAVWQEPIEVFYATSFRVE
jgi:hypothetical protein